MPNVLIQPVSGAIYFDTATAGSSTPSLTNNYAFLSASNTGTLYLIGAGTSSERLRVIGTQGNLFSVIDALTGSLFSVNKIGGLPILEVLDTDTVRAGTYLSNTLLVSGTQVGLGGLPVTVNAFPHRLTVYGRSTFTDFLSTRSGTSDNWNSTYSYVNTNSGNWPVNTMDTFTGTYNISLSDNVLIVDSNSRVNLPVATNGRNVTIKNNFADGIRIFPNTNQTIEGVADFLEIDYQDSVTLVFYSNNWNLV